MREQARIAVIMPALDEEASISGVLARIPEWVDDIVVVDNGSLDDTVGKALAGGARVVSEPIRGYGTALQAGIRALGVADVVVFLDADESDFPEEMASLVDPVVAGDIDLAIGSRVLGRAQSGSLTTLQRFGNGAACILMRVFWGARFTDLGPFRAIGYRHLVALGLKDENFGWTIEMQIKAQRQGLRIIEVPVSYRRRIHGESKISGSWWGSLSAGAKILKVIASAVYSSTYLTSDKG